MGYRWHINFAIHCHKKEQKLKIMRKAYLAVTCFISHFLDICSSDQGFNTSEWLRWLSILALCRINIIIVEVYMTDESLCVCAQPMRDDVTLYRVPTRSLFPGKVLTFNNGSLGPGKVLSFSSFPKIVLEKSLFSYQTQVDESMLDVKYFSKFSKQPVSKFMLCKFSSQNI